MAKKRTKKAKVSRVSNQSCATQGCPNAAYYVHSLLCHACYQGARYWANKTVTHRAKRRNQLRVLAVRLDDVERG